MRSSSLKAVVIGAGWAGEGLSLALRNAGVEVAALCSRNPEVTASVAQRLEIPRASTDWRATLDAEKPDIVALGTPAALRIEVIEKAVALGCHILCEKPLATTAEEAGRMYSRVREAGVKHAYAATHRYDPSVVWLAELMKVNEVGWLQEAVVTIRFGPPKLMPYSWMSTLATGGGLMNQGLTHLFGILERIVGGELTHVMGESRIVTNHAPVVADIHDFRKWRESSEVVYQEEMEKLEWRKCDADGAISAMCRFQCGNRSVVATFLIGPGTGLPSDGMGMRLYGEVGTLAAEGMFSYNVTKILPGREPEPLPIPERLQKGIPPAESDEQRKWNALARDFVADIEGQTFGQYLTFRDGWRYQQAIDAIRSAGGWTLLKDDAPRQ